MQRRRRLEIGIALCVLVSGAHFFVPSGNSSAFDCDVIPFGRPDPCIRTTTPSPGVEFDLTGINVSCAAPNSSILLYGNNFRSEWIGEHFVRFGNLLAPVLGASPNTLITRVPPNIEEGSVAVFVVPQVDRVSSALPLEVDQNCTTNLGFDIPDLAVETGFMPGEIVVIFNSEVTAEQIDAFKHEAGFDSLQGWSLGPGSRDFYIGRLLPGASSAETAVKEQQISQDSRVRFADLNWLVDLMQTDATMQNLPNDPGAARQEHIIKLNYPLSWERFFPGEGVGVSIAVIDTGMDLDLTNEVSINKIWPGGLDISPGSESNTKPNEFPEARDEIGHGTQVSTIAAARANNGFGGVGVAFNATIIPIKIFGSRGRSTEVHVAIGILVAARLGADVVNISAGCRRCFKSIVKKHAKLYDEMLDFIEGGFFREKITKMPIIVAAAGNDGAEYLSAPARNSRVISAGSYNLETQARSGYSNYGPEMDFVTPGDNVYTTQLGGGFSKIEDGGTSYSSPQIAGLVALMLSAEPTLARLGVDAVREKIRNCFTLDVGAPGFDEETGFGLIHIPEISEVAIDQCIYF